MPADLNIEQIAKKLRAKRRGKVSPQTLERLEKLAVNAQTGPMQVAALLLEHAVQTAASVE